MKKVIILVAAILVTFQLQASTNENVSYVKANGKVYFCNKVKLGLTNVTISTSTGEKIRIPNNKVEGYMTDNASYAMMPTGTNPNSKKVMMKFIAVRQGLSLYKIATPANQDATDCDCFRVYDQGKLYLNIDERNAPEVFSYFGIKICE
jgi:hypothetical protein